MADWYQALTVRGMAQADRVLSLLAQHGNLLRMPQSRALGDGLFELRFTCEEVARRITFTFEPERKVFTLTTFRKQRQNEQREIDPGEKGPARPTRQTAGCEEQGVSTMANHTWDELRANRTARMAAGEKAAYREAYDEAALAHDLATLVYDARIAAGVTQAELARRMGTHQSVIARLENGGGVPSIPTLDRLARALGMHLQIAVNEGEHGPTVVAD